MKLLMTCWNRIILVSVFCFKNILSQDRTFLEMNRNMLKQTSIVVLGAEIIDINEDFLTTREEISFSQTSPLAPVKL